MDVGLCIFQRHSNGYMNNLKHFAYDDEDKVW